MAETIHHIDQATWVTDDDAAIVVAGWCARVDARPIASVRARSRNATIGETATIPRDDVAAHLGRVSARLSGFVLRLPPIDDDQLVELCAVAEGGEALAFHAFRGGELPGRGAIIVGYADLRARGWPFDRIQLPVSGPVGSMPAPEAPLFSVLLPTHNTPERLLRECLESVLAQSYPHWELCLVDDGSHLADTHRVRDEFARRDPRIRTTALAAHGGISRATNHALSMARGTFIALLDHDDRLLPDALATMAAAIADPGNSDCDILYSDEEKIDDGGRPRRPILKPAFSPLFLCGVMYVGHLLCVRRSLALAAGGFDPGFDRVQDYEFLLRASKDARCVVHVPEILYQWRMAAGSIAVHGDAKGGIDGLQQRAVEDHLRRTGWSACARSVGPHRIELYPPGEFRRPTVTVFAEPAVAGSSLLRELEGVEVVVTHGPGAALAALIDETRATRGDLVAYLALPLVAASECWLDQLAFLALAPRAGRVSPVLRSSDNRVLEAGRTRTPAGRSIAMMSGFDPASDGYNGSLVCSREVLAASPTIWLAQARMDASCAARCDCVCASAWVRTNAALGVPGDPLHAMQDIPPGRTEDPYFNPRFDRETADYRLV